VFTDLQYMITGIHTDIQGALNRMISVDNNPQKHKNNFWPLQYRPPIYTPGTKSQLFQQASKMLRKYLN